MCIVELFLWGRQSSRSPYSIPGKSSWLRLAFLDSTPKMVNTPAISDFSEATGHLAPRYHAACSCQQVRLMSSQLNQNLESLEAKTPTLFDRLFRDKDGNIVIIQPPNLPIMIGSAAALLHFFLPQGDFQRGVGLLAFGILFTWGWLELFEGLSPFRRGLGLLALIGLMTLAFNL